VSQAERGRQVELLLVAIPEIDRDPGGLDPSFPLPAKPVVGRFSRAVQPALDLEGGGGDAEAEAVGQKRSI